jgi:hypothetical protein
MRLSKPVLSPTSVELHQDSSYLNAGRLEWSWTILGLWAYDAWIPSRLHEEHFEAGNGSPDEGDEAVIGSFAVLPEG